MDIFVTLILETSLFLFLWSSKQRSLMRVEFPSFNTSETMPQKKVNTIQIEI